MKSIGLQFFANSEEILSMLIEAIKELDLHFVVMILKPFKLSEVSIDDLQKITDETDSQNRIRISMKHSKFEINCGKKTEFLDNNPSACHLDIGRFYDNSLEESFFSIKTEDENGMKIAKEIAKRIKKMTNVGGTAISPTTGEKSYYKNIMYTRGAAEMLRNGIKMKPVAGNTFIVFGKQ